MSARDEYEYLRNHHPRFDEIRAKLLETVWEEAPETQWAYSPEQNPAAYEAFVDNFRRVERAHYNPLDPLNEGLLERSRNRDIDASKQMLIRSGIAQSLLGE